MTNSTDAEQLVNYNYEDCPPIVTHIKTNPRKFGKSTDEEASSVSAISRKSRATLSSSISFSYSPKIYEKIFDFAIQPGVNILLGGSTSGVREYIKDFKNAFVVRGSNLSSKDSFSSIVGSPPGYVGSEHATEIYKYLSSTTNGTIIIDDLGSAKNSILDEFVSMILSGSFKELAGDMYNRPAVSTKGVRLVLNVEKIFKNTTLLSDTELKNELRKSYDVDGQVLLNDRIIDLSKNIKYFYTLSKFEEQSKQILSQLNCSNVDKLFEAAQYFELGNTELIPLMNKSIELKTIDGDTRLLVDNQVFKEVKHLKKSHFKRFVENLDGYLGQEEAREAVLTGMMMKLESTSTKPIVLLCIGPPGVGKTEIAKRLGDAVDNFVRINGNTIRGITDLVGAYDKAGELSQLVKGIPNVLLVDEMEKLDAECIRSLLQLTDEGLVDDQFRKETYTLRDLLIIMTSNILTDPTITESEAREKLKNYKHIPEEFIDRVDIIVPFRLFTFEEKVEIADMFARKEMFRLDKNFYPGLEELDSIRQIEKSVRRAKASAKVREFIR